MQVAHRAQTAVQCRAGPVARPCPPAAGRAHRRCHRSVLEAVPAYLSPQGPSDVQGAPGPQPGLGLAGLATAVALLGSPEAAQAIQMEPANALSLPTWAIHVSSVVEWVTAMGLMWKYAEVTGNQRWKGMTWGMLPALGSAMSACTWHFFYNSPDLEFLVALQAFLTVVGNTTCLMAAYRIYEAAQAEAKA